MTSASTNNVSAAQTRAARAILGWNQQQLADKANVATSTVADYERGKRIPVPNNLIAIRSAFESVGVHFIDGGLALTANGSGCLIERKGVDDFIKANTSLQR